jgi:serine/threonine-protein kinase
MITRFGAYEILYELKAGGMGSVLLGRRRGPGAFEQLVAIKTILPQYAQAAAVRAMFLDEAALLARLSHPAIATVHDFGEDNGTLYMVMEYVAGIAFRDVLAYGPPPAVAARAIAEAARGLHAAHELRDLAGNVLGVVHRDISPDNLMLGFDGHVKVIDFGIALVKNRQAPVTELGTVKGKPPYMSPEQIKNEAVDRRSDVFSLAVVLWELLTGRGLFDGDSIYAIARAVEHQDLVPPSHELGAPLPLGLDAAVMNALDRDLAHRTPSAAALAEQLDDVVQAAGDESLPAWAARVLEAPRLAHRAWLASVVAGKDAPRPVGRPTGSVTALAPAIGRAPTLVAPVGSAARPTGEPEDGPTHLARPDGAPEVASRGSRRSLALPIALALVVLAMGVGVLGRWRGREVAAPRDGGAVVMIAGDAGEADAPVDARAEVPVDAAPPADAAPPDAPLDRRDLRRHRAPVDASRAVPQETPAVAGFGFLTAKHKGDRYLNVVIDGRIVGPTPVFAKQLAAGRHTIELVDPASSSVVTSRTVQIEPDQRISVDEP